MSLLVEVLDEIPAGAQRVQRRFYMPELDGLRFYAFLGVFLCHSLPVDPLFYRQLHWPLPWLWSAICQTGAAGVDVFFALSAYLITSLLLKEQQQTGSIALKHFYLRRILRIWPLYFLTLGLGVIFSLATTEWPHGFYYTQVLPWYYIVGYLLFVGNWVCAAAGPIQSICAPLWTVSIEEQFYLIWPIFAKVLNRRRMLMVAIVTFFGAIGCQVAIALSGGKGSYLYFGSASRCDSLALGIVIALTADSLPQLKSGHRLLLVAGGVLALIVSTAWIANSGAGIVSLNLVVWLLIIALGAASILYGCIGSTSRLLNGSWVVRLGKISYGLYMLHATALLIVLSIFHPSRGYDLLAGKCLGLVVTICLALASYRWIETPFLKLKSRFGTVRSRPV